MFLPSWDVGYQIQPFMDLISKSFAGRSLTMDYKYSRAGLEMGGPLKETILISMC